MKRGRSLPESVRKWLNKKLTVLPFGERSLSDIQYDNLIFDPVSSNSSLGLNVRPF